MSETQDECSAGSHCYAVKTIREQLWVQVYMWGLDQFASETDVRNRADIAVKRFDEKFKA